MIKKLKLNFHKTNMAKLLFTPPVLNLTPCSTSLLPPSSSTTHSQKPSSLPISIKITSSSTFGFSVNPTMAQKASSAAAAASPIQDNVGDMLGEVSIFTASGQPVKFSDLWDQKEGMAVVALMRHFGCFCSWEHALTLKEAKDRFDSSGVKLIAVGVGTPDKAQILAERLPFPSDCLYADPDRKAYDVLGLYYGVRRTLLSDKTFSRKDSLKKAMENYTITATPNISSVFQQGGMFVFKGKELLYARKDEVTGDHAPLDDVLDICCKVPAA